MSRPKFVSFVLLVLCVFASPLFAQGKKLPATQADSPIVDFLVGSSVGSASAYERDVAIFRSAHKLKGSALWARATSVLKDRASPEERFLGSFGLAIDSTSTPATLELLEMIRVRLEEVKHPVVDGYKKNRPFVYLSTLGGSCILEDESRLADDGPYFSGASARDWGWALVLAEISPERRGAVLGRGHELGLFRVICGLDWQSDVEAAQKLAAAVVDQLFHDRKFQRALNRAKREIALLRESKAEPVAPLMSMGTKTIPPGFVRVSEFVPDVLLDIRYYSSYNFVGARVDGYRVPVAILVRDAARALARAAYLARECGYVLRVFDGYRPQMAVDHFVRWAKDQDDKRTKDIFYPDVDKSDLFSRGYIMEKSGHTRGATVDLTLVEISTGREVDMGSPFDFFGPVSHHGASGISVEQARNRAILRSIMQMAGFVPYEKEWWHYTLANEPYPETYFKFPID